MFGITGLVFACATTSTDSGKKLLLPT